jgi:hypothetical protein
MRSASPHIAAALEAGEGDPGQPHTEQADHDIAAARRKAPASQIVVERRHTELAQALDEHGAAWTDSVEDQLREACADWQKQLDELMAQHAHIGQLRSLLAFTQKGRYSGAAGVLPHVGRLPDDLTADMAMSALRRFARVERQQEQQTAGQAAA